MLKNAPARTPSTWHHRIHEWGIAHQLPFRGTSSLTITDSSASISLKVYYTRNEVNITLSSECKLLTYMHQLYTNYLCAVIQANCIGIFIKQPENFHILARVIKTVLLEQSIDKWILLGMIESIRGHICKWGDQSLLPQNIDFPP